MDKKEMTNREMVAEINMHIRDGLNQWADIMLTAEADDWAKNLKYFPRDIINATYIFMHVCSGVGIKAGIIDEKKSAEFGARVRELVKEYTGYDPAVIMENLKQ